MSRPECQVGAMRGVLTVLSVLLVTLTAAPAAKPSPKAAFTSPDAVLRWINGYRHKPDPANVPGAMKALSTFGALNDPEKAGVYVGFMAGALLSNPSRAEDMISKI